MNNMRILVVFLIIVVLATSVYSPDLETPQETVLGLSPAIREVCMGPEETISTVFYPSTNSKTPFEIEINIESSLEIAGNHTILLNPNGLTEYKLYIIEPPAGFYTSNLYFCSSETIGTQDIKTCVKARLLVNVTETCASNDIIMIIAKNKFYLQMVIGGIIAILLASLLYNNIFSQKQKASKYNKKHQKSKKYSQKTRK